MVSTNSLQNAESASFLVGLTQAATIGGAMQLAYAGAGFKYDGPVTPGADALAAMAQANGAILEAERMKGMLDVSLHGEIDLIISQIRAARASGDVGAIREATQRLREGLDTARAIQTTNNNEMTDAQQRMEAAWARADELTHRINDVLDDVNTPQEQARRDAAAAAQAQARDNLRRAIASGDPAAIAAARDGLRIADTEVTNADRDATTSAVARGVLAPDAGAAVTTDINDRGSIFDSARGDTRSASRGVDVNTAAVNGVNYGPAPSANAGNDRTDVANRITTARTNIAGAQTQYETSSLFDGLGTPQPAASAQPAAPTAFAVAEYDGSTLGRPAQPGGPNGSAAISV